MATAEQRLPLTILCGKGGVGKTTLSLALALDCARRGKNALVVTSHPLAELAVSISLDGIKERFPQAAAHLFVLHIDPREILNSTVRQRIPSDFLAEAVITSRIYQSLIEVAPGLKEIAFLGRLWNLAQQRAPETDERRFDLLVWDAPSTGHFLQTLQVSKNFETYLSGPFASLGGELRAFFSSAANFSVVPVTTLEEMAVEETIELVRALSTELSIQPRRVICNLASPLLALMQTGTASASEELFGAIASSGRENPSLQFILSRHAVERALYARLRAAITAEYHIVERQTAPQTDLELLLAVSQQMEGVPGE